jgi:hypothetical protein
MDSASCLEVPPGGKRGSVLWFDGERFQWLDPGGEGSTLTMGSDGAPFWANPAGLTVPKNGPPKNGPPEQPM